MNVSKLALLCAGTIMAAAASLPASAQTGSPAFRVPIGGSNSSSSAPPVYAWLESISECSATCGSGTRTTSFQCQNAADFDYSGSGYGAPEEDSFCTSAVGPKPSSSSSSCTNYSGCGYDWVKPPVQRAAVPLDSNPVGRIGCGYVHEQFAPYCQRTGGSSAVVLPAGDYRYCRNDTPDYNDVAAGDPDALGYDRKVVQTDVCNTTDHEWRSGNWGGWSDTCSNSATHTRSVTCYRKFDNKAVADAECSSSTRPASSETKGVYDSCSYGWVGGGDGDWGPWSSTCSTTATHTRNPQCRRSNGDIVADSECTDRSQAKPSTTETKPIYSSCTYAAGGTTTNGAWNSQCSSNASRTVTRQCVRSNGDVVADSECTSRGVSLTSTQTQAVYDQCGYSFSTGQWSGWSSNCSSSATRTRSVTCMRSDGTAVADAECTNRGQTRPPSSETQGVYDQCGYSAGGSTSYGPWNTQCSSNAQRTVSRQCIRSDGSVVADSECTNRGVGLTSTQTAAVYDQCGYSYSAGGWSAWSSNCSSSATRTRSVQCMRSDGTPVSDAECSNRGVARPAASETQAVYDGCGYTPRDMGRSACTMQGQQNQYWDCTRSDGTTGFPASYCGKTNPEVVSCTPPYTYSPHDHGVGACQSNNTRPHYWDCMRNDGQDGFPASYCGKSNPEYESCSYVSYGWNAGGWSDWNSHCSGSATRTRSVWCQGSDGSTVGDAQCGGGKPATSETSAVYDQCSYGATYGSWSTCTNSQQSRSVDCRRQDGVQVDPSYCGVVAPNNTQTQSCNSTPQTGEGQCIGGTQVGVWGYSYVNSVSTGQYQSRDYPRGYNNIQFPDWCFQTKGGTCWDEHETYYVADERAGGNQGSYEMRCFTGTSQIRNGISYDASSPDGLTVDRNNWWYHLK